MPDPLTDGVISGTFTQLANFIGAAGGLGLAAAGLVDATKAFAGGSSNIGFRQIVNTLRPFDAALTIAVGPGADWQHMLWAHWINGRSKDEQKAIAKSLIRLGLSPQTAPILAAAAGLSETILTAATVSIANGVPLTGEQLNILGRLDAVVETRLDAAFERADQAYRNVSKVLAAAVSVILAVGAGGILYADDLAKAVAATTSNGLAGYFTSRQFALALILGIVAVPLAPISKDLISALGTAMRGLKTPKA